MATQNQIEHLFFSMILHSNLKLNFKIEIPSLVFILTKLAEGYDI